MKYGLVCGIVFALGMSTAALGAAQEPEVAPDSCITYREVGGQALSAHVFYPAGHTSDRASNGILLLHGGGWHMGTPEWTFAASRRFADWGLVAIAVEYRLSEGDVTPIEALEDVCGALGWARQHAGDLGLTGGGWLAMGSLQVGTSLLRPRQ
jgi:acetyl esterase